MTGETGEILDWVPGAGWRPGTDDPAKLLVVDSWLLEDGLARGFDLHCERFRRSCQETGRVTKSEVDDFVTEARARLPRSGTWFPRMDLRAERAGPRLRLRIRPAPERSDSVVLWPYSGVDARTHPHRKGPDLARLEVLRRRAVETGAGEALLTTPRGYVLEGATSSLLWWEGDTLCLPDPRWRLLRGVTLQLICRAADAEGIPVRSRRRRVSELAGREVWLVNALHGIRPVVGWVRAGISAGPATRAVRWRQWWRDCAEKLD